MIARAAEVGAVPMHTAAAPTTATEIARSSTIAEQNMLIAAAYFALLDARDRKERADSAINAAIGAIESYRQRRDPECRA